MKKRLAKYLLFIYDNYIIEDWSIYNKVGKIICYGPWFVRAVLVWLICPIFITQYRMEERMKVDPQFKKMIEKNRQEFQQIMNNLK
jgi:hypothetical protein